MRGHAVKAEEDLARRRQAAAEARAKADAEAAAEERRLAACEYLFIPPCMAGLHGGIGGRGGPDNLHGLV